MSIQINANCFKWAMGSHYWQIQSPWPTWTPSRPLQHTFTPFFCINFEIILFIKCILFFKVPRSKLRTINFDFIFTILYDFFLYIKHVGIQYLLFLVFSGSFFVIKKSKLIRISFQRHWNMLEVPKMANFGERQRRPLWVC